VVPVYAALVRKIQVSYEAALSKRPQAHRLTVRADQRRLLTPT
jgi:hypothetical protein